MAFTRLAAGGGDGAAGDGHVTVCIDASAIAVASCRIAAHSVDFGGIGDGHVTARMDTAALGVFIPRGVHRAAGGGNGAAGDGHIGCIDAVALGLRRAARDGQLAAALDGQVALEENAVAAGRVFTHAGDGVFRAFRQDDFRALGQLHRGSGGGGKVHSVEGEGFCVVVPCAVRCACFRGVEQRQRRVCVDGEVRRCLCRPRRQRGGGQQTQAQYQGKQDAESPP